MAGNRRVFTQAMRTGANAAWDGDWEQAISAYKSALAEFPSDVSALTALGLSYSGAGQLESALESCQRANELAPDDPVLLERIGKTWEQLGQGEKSAEAYAASADQYLSQQQATNLALQRWQDAVRAYPDHHDSHAQLLQYYQRHGRVGEAIKECLVLARINQARGQNDYAAQICRHGLRLAPRDPELLAALDSIMYGEQAAVEPGAEVAEQGTEPLGDIGEPNGSIALKSPPVSDSETATRGRGSPIEIARQKALTDLAESVFEDEDEEIVTAPPPGAGRLNKPETDALITQAINFQTRGRIEDAISAYERMGEAGVDEPAAHFNLGLLYQEKLRFDDAISQFQRAISKPEYALGAHFALGECYRAKGRIDEAVGHFIEVLKIADLATVRRDQARDLIQLYESFADRYIARGEREQTAELASLLVAFLSEEGWEDKVVQWRQRLDAVAQEGPTLSLAEMLTVPGAEHILESLSLAQEYAEGEKLYAALEECYYALERAPTYLPIHRQLAQVLLGMGKVDGAISKLVVIADTYRVRGDIRQASAMYERALKLAPMHTAVRAKMIDLLVSYGEIDGALEHYLILADSYYHLAQMDQARDTYQESLRIAPRGDLQRRWEVRILHKIGDIDMQRVDWKRAAGVYEQVRALAPDDERACLTLMELHYRFNRPDLAVSELDSLLKTYHENGKTERIFAVLEDAVQGREEDIPLQTRLAQAYLNAGRVEQALRQLDRLGDLQLEAGRSEEAKATIRAIIALNPPDVADYQQLLDGLG